MDEVPAEAKTSITSKENGFRITTWNVNGIRNPFGYQPWRTTRTFPAMFEILGADIVIMQELKIQRKDLKDDMVLLDGWDCFFSLPKHKKGYSGVGIYTRQSTCAPIKAEEGLLGVLFPPGSSTRYCDLPEDQAIGGYPTPLQLIDIDVDPAELDAEGRCVVLEFPAFVLFGVYSPANSNGMRDDFRFGFVKALDARIRNLQASGKRVVLTGDLNISRDDRDSANVKDDLRKMNITRDEYLLAPNRRIFNQLIDGGEVIGERDEGREDSVLVDLCREFFPDRTGMYTHWEQKINARPGNYGSRIDYVLASKSMKDWFSEANIQEGLMGSDHCPVYATIKPIVTLDGIGVTAKEILNPMETSQAELDGQVIAPRPLLPLSGKLLPEFDKRRSIKDMFMRPNASKSFGSTLQTPFSAESAAARRMSSSLSPNKKDDGGSSSGPPANQKAKLSKPMNSPPAKRQKTSHKDTKVASSSQKTLKSFFQSKQPPPEPKVVPTKTESPSKENEPSTPTMSPINSSAKSPAVALEAHSILASSQRSELSFKPPLKSVAGDSAVAEEDNFIDPFTTRTEWTKLFSKRDDPRCEGHDLPCITLQTKVKGPNRGRWFWICPRPVGPSGIKESGTEWRCGTFIWASDAKGG
ncbi:DNA lyase-like protein [Microthyrium microscopicum]|uniref:DNA-(apurinic or apyrimidinic site) endonuclease 2 n=1 Tax=Microthyrium microscopicum TaxID=703497 RepID=A0A6A6UU08_9PEZI|nr:DNA lyase-like protein [Microthyrium microscopicum]